MISKYSVISVIFFWIVCQSTRSSALESSPITSPVSGTVGQISINIQVDKSRFDSLETEFFYEELANPALLPGYEKKNFVSENGLYKITYKNKKAGFLQILGCKQGDRHTIFNRWCLLAVEPGDSVTIQIGDNNVVNFLGRSAKKYQVMYRLLVELRESTLFKGRELKDLFEIHAYDSVQRVKTTLLEKHRALFSKTTYDRLSLQSIVQGWHAAYYGMSKGWYYARKSVEKQNELRTIYKKYLKDFFPRIDSLKYPVSLFPERYHDIIVLRKFNLEKNMFGDSLQKNDYYFKLIAKNFTGELKDKIITDLTIKLFGRYPFIEEFLRDSLSTVKTDRYHRILKTMTDNYQLGKPAFNFELRDTNNRVIRLADLKGKVVFMDFWYTGCAACIAYHQSVVDPVKTYFKGNPKVQFATVSIDGNYDNWVKSVRSGRYTTSDALNMYTGGMGSEHPLIKHYYIQGYPTAIIIDDKGNNLSLTAVKRLKALELVNFLNEATGKKNKPASMDLAHVFYKDGTLVNHIYSANKGRDLNVPKSSPDKNMVNITFPDQPGWNFSVPLMNQYKNEATVFPKADKLLVLSDIEGNFGKFRELLINNGVMNEQCQWTFGNGHLVLLGDLVDRGSQVYESLWLVYALEQQAKAANGYVHYILGNHEIMNLSGDYRYVNLELMRSLQTYGIQYASLFDSNSEIGKWLRTKDIAQQIGDILFVHGGMSPTLTQSGLSLEKMNTLAKPYYNQTRNQNAIPAEVKVLFDDGSSPFWYRGFYSGATSAQIDSVLQVFNASHIVTGHTIVADTVGVYFDGRLFNTDTPHAEGKSEALLIEGTKFFRINDKGQRWVLSFNATDHLYNKYMEENKKAQD